MPRSTDRTNPDDAGPDHEQPGQARPGAGPPDDALLGRLLAAIERELPRAVELRHRLHAEPELAHEEHRTAASVAAELPVACDAVAGTGLLARVGDRGGSIAPALDAAGASSPDTAPVAVRAELDGLPLTEQTGAPFTASGAAMHACGHDVHMAALVALTRAAHDLGDALPVPLLAVFQPSEETYPSGAQQLAEGALARLAPAAIVAAHVHPELPWGAVALDPGTVNASCDAFEITVEGEPSHGAYPHRGRDPILALAQVVVALHAQASRRIDPLSPASLTVGVLQAGSAENVIPAHAYARGALRAHRPQDRLALRQMLEEVTGAIAAAHGCRASVELVPGEPGLENDPGIVARARELLARAGLTAAPEWRSCGSDDFAFLGALAPVAMAFVGLDGADGFTVRPLHHPELLPPDAAVGAVARAQAVMYVAAAAPSRSPAGHWPPVRSVDRTG
jgi:amidohydrolase